MPKRKKKKKNIVQNHHVSYNPEVVVRVFKGEHKILSEIQLFCRKKVSVGFMKALKQALADLTEKIETNQITVRNLEKEVKEA